MLHKGKAPNAPELFDSAEATIMSDAMIALSKHAPTDAAILSKRISQLQILNQIVYDSPSLSSQETLGGITRSPQSLVKHLTTSDGLIGDLDLPVKATLQRCFLLAKIQLFRGLVKSFSPICDKHPDEFKPLAVDLRAELAQSIYTQMAEDLLLALLRKPTVKIPTKRRAARQLIQIWDNATVEIDDFCPLLESAWHARNRVNPGLGSLLGTTEYFRLVAEDCSDSFLDFFARDGVSEAENQAFAEFLFGLTWDELETLRNEMKRQQIDVSDEAWAAKVLGREIEHDCDDSNNIDPIALYRSYTRRQLAADYRIVSGKPGPRRTAESYLMIYLLNNEADLATMTDLPTILG
jgi:translation initiation factor 2 beta subunit (eIF-2beta)/eIF-5